MSYYADDELKICPVCQEDLEPCGNSNFKGIMECLWLCNKCKVAYRGRIGHGIGERNGLPTGNLSPGG